MVNELEITILGVCLLTGSVDDCDLVSQDFHSEDHQRIWSAMRAVRERGDPIDVITVSDELADNRLAAACTEYALHAPGSQNISSYAKRLRDYAIERRLVQTCSRIIDLAHGEGSAGEKVAKAQAMLSGVEPQEDEKDELKSFVEYLESEPTKLRAGFFDEHTGGIESGLWIVAASTGVGKSTLALNLSNNLLNFGPVTFYSYEMGSNQVVGKMVSGIGSVPYTRIRDRAYQADDWDATTKALTRLKAKGFKVVDKALDIDSLCAHIRQSKRKRGICAAFVDYLQLVPSYGDSRVLEVGNISRKLKLLSLDLSIPIFALSQLSRKHEERSNPRPRNSDLRESGSIEQDADVIMFLFDESKLDPDSPRKGITELYASKNRNGELFSVAMEQQLHMSRFIPYSGHLPPARDSKPDFRG
jgi:replicative DNA helicase